MALNFPSPAYDGEIYVDPTSGSKYVYVAASTKWMSIQHVPVVISYGFNKANSAYLTANAAYDMANAAYNSQNVDYTLSNSAFTHANAVYESSNSNWTVQNALYTVANSSFAKANAALANTSGTYFSGDLFFPSGNVGIGATTANAKLYIRATNEETGLRVISYQQTAIVGYSSAGGAGGGFYSKDFNGIDVTADASGYGARITSRSGYGAYITSISGSPLVVGKTAGADYLTVTTSGNTGFGTSTPAYRIDVAGGANISNPTLIVADQNVISVLVSSYDKANTALQNTSGTFAGNLNVAGNALPTLDNTYTLGTSAYRWQHIYTGDLHLSNEKTQGNSIDGTTGNWTLQEGENDLFILNNKTGKKYKFKLEEIQ